MRLPKQVQEASDRADKVIEELRKPKDAPTPPATPQEAAPPQDVTTPPAPDSDTPPATTAAPSAEPPEPKERQDWKARALSSEAKYSTLQGMFNAEVPRLNAEVRRLSQSLNAANSKIEELESAARSAPTAPATDGPLPIAQRPDALKALSDTMGEDVAKVLIDALSTNAKAIEELKSQVKKDIEPVKKGVEQVQQNAQQTAQEKFMTELSALVPDWVQIDASAEWNAWLLSEDDFGSQRQMLLNSAAAKGNVRAAANLFNEFKKLAGIQASATPEAKPAALEKQQVPAPSTQTVTPSTPTVKQWTKAQLAQLVKEAASGRVPQAEVDKAFAEIRAGGLTA